jgi:starch phosphorylase
MKLRDTLLDLASDLLWSWKPWYRDFLSGLDPAAFQQHENPVRLVRDLSDERLKALDKDKAFQASLAEVLKLRESEYAAARARCPEGLRGRQVAYFSAEFGIHNSLPIYSGGLGVLSGDHIKSAHDLGLPFTGIGLMYRQGYFGQRIDTAGVQHADMELMNLESLPVRRTAGPEGEPLEVEVDLPGRSLRLQVWEVRVGIARLLLLDSDCEHNAPADRSLTWQLYGGDRDTRMAQEIILGIGGVRALRALGLAPDAWPPVGTSRPPWRPWPRPPSSPRTRRCRRATRPSCCRACTATSTNTAAKAASTSTACWNWARKRTPRATRSSA